MKRYETDLSKFDFHWDPRENHFVIDRKSLDPRNMVKFVDRF